MENKAEPAARDWLSAVARVVIDAICELHHELVKLDRVAGPADIDPKSSERTAKRARVGSGDSVACGLCQDTKGGHR